MAISTISPKELKDRIQAGDKVDLIDVRTPAEYREVHVQVAKNYPLESFDVGAVLAQHPGTNPLYVICRSGSRGKQACEKLLAAGCTHAVNVEGGTMACEQAGVEVVHGKKTLSLERQVRICAGFMALTGGVLGMLVHPYFSGIAAFVGAGLMFAGITDTCGMAMILARMPWNQVSKSPSSPPVKNCSTTSNPSCCG